MEVLSPCPVKTFVCSGRIKSFDFILRISSLILPVGKSVLPTDAANKVSPEKSISASSI